MPDITWAPPGHPAGHTSSDALASDQGVDLGLPGEDGLAPDPLGGNVPLLRDLAPMRVGVCRRPVRYPVLVAAGPAGIEVREIGYDHHLLVAAGPPATPD